jgi:hypothetical protein
LRCPQIVQFEIRKLGQDIVFRHPGTEHFQHIFHPNTHVTNAGFPSALLGIDRNAIQDVHHKTIRPEVIVAKLSFGAAVSLFHLREGRLGDVAVHRGIQARKWPDKGQSFRPVTTPSAPGADFRLNRSRELFVMSGRAPRFLAWLLLTRRNPNVVISSPKPPLS